MKKILLLSIVTLGFSIANAIVPPGYLGKRFMLGYDIGVSPAYTSPNKNLINGYTSFNDMHALTLEYVLSKNITLYSELQYFKSGIQTESTLSYRYSEDFWGLNKYEYAVNSFNFNTYGMELQFRRYTKLAPRGFYTGFLVGFRRSILPSEFELSQVSQNVSFNYQSDPYLNKNTITKSTDELSYSALTLGVNSGISRVFYDRLRLTYSVSYRFGISGSKNFAFYDYNTGEEIEFTDYIEFNARKRVLYHNFFTFKLGISFLAL